MKILKRSKYSNRDYIKFYIDCQGLIIPCNAFTSSIKQFQLPVVVKSHSKQYPYSGRSRGAASRVSWNPPFGLVCYRKFIKSKTNCQVQQVVATSQNIKNNAYITLYTYLCSIVASVSFFHDFQVHMPMYGVDYLENILLLQSCYALVLLENKES